MSKPLRLVLSLVAVLVSLLATTEARAADYAVDLYTIGPGAYLYSRFGHSLLCVREAGSEPTEEKGKCYDYGFADRPDALQAFMASSRGEAIMVPVAIDTGPLLKFFRDQGRQIERQSLPLSRDEAARLVDILETDVRERRAYAYDPYRHNCSTKLRDRIDEVTGGRLHEGPTSIPKLRFREHIEDALSGHVLELVAITILYGPGADREPTSWEVMGMPYALREGVAERFDVPAVRVAEHIGARLETSRVVGRLALFFLAGLLFVAVRLCVKRQRLRLALAIVGVTLGLMAIPPDLMAAISVFPEMKQNWALLVLLPTDFALPFLTGRKLVLYLRARVGLAAVLAVLEIASVIPQPLLPLAALVLLPFGALLGALRAPAAAKVSAVATPART